MRGEKRDISYWYLSRLSFPLSLLLSFLFSLLNQTGTHLTSPKKRKVRR